jgi:hypothetical protein
VSDLTTLWASLRTTSTAVAVVAGVLVVLLLTVWLVVRVTRRGRAGGSGRIRGRAVENALTLAAAGVATGVAAVGMWRFFGDVLHIDSVALRGALFAFLEIALFVSAIRARRNLLDDLERISTSRAMAEQTLTNAADEPARRVAQLELGRVAAQRASTGLDGVAVWALAALSGTFAALDARSFAESVFRLAAPLVAAWLWERGLAAHRRQHRGRSSINWKLTPERVLVKLGLAEPTGRAVGEIDVARRKARLARSAYRLHTLTGAGAPRWRISLEAWRLRRQVEQATEHIGLASDPAVRADVRVHLATLYQAVAGTAPAAVGDLSPWSTAGTSGELIAVPVQVDVDQAQQRAQQMADAAMTVLDDPGAPVTEPDAVTTVVVAPGAGGTHDTASADGPPVASAGVGGPRRGEQLSPATAGVAPVSSASVLGTAAPRLQLEPTRAAASGREGSLRSRVYATLDSHVPAGDGRDNATLIALVGEWLQLSQAERPTAATYVRSWKRDVEAGRRTPVAGRRLRSVPPGQR